MGSLFVMLAALAFGGGAGGLPSASICEVGQAQFEFSVTGFLTPPVTLDLLNLPAGVSASFSENPVLALPATVTITLTSDGSTAAGSFPFEIEEDTAGFTEINDWILHIFEQVPATPTLTFPDDGALQTSRFPTMAWLPGAHFETVTLEIDDDPNFMSPDYVANNLIGGSHTLDREFGLPSDTNLFWRLRPLNPCGEGAASAVRSFMTTSIVCNLTDLVIPDDDPVGISSVIEIAAGDLITDMEILLSIMHSRVGDLEVRLRHVETDTQVILLNRPGFPANALGCEEDVVSCEVHDFAQTIAENMCRPVAPAINGHVRPFQRLSGFRGENSAGMWELTIIDHEAGESGTSLAWCIAPSYAPVCADDRAIRIMNLDWPFVRSVLGMIDTVNIGCPVLLPH